MHKSLTKIAKHLSEESVGEAETSGLQVEHEARVAQLYGLTDDEFNVVLDAMPRLPESAKQAGRNSFRSL